MKNKKITFAEKANQIKSKYYKNRKFGDDKITDESFEMEMTNLMKQQESIKGTNNSKQYKNGGSLPKYDGDSEPTNFITKSGWRKIISDEEDALYSEDKANNGGDKNKSYNGGNRAYILGNSTDKEDALDSEDKAYNVGYKSYNVGYKSYSGGDKAYSGGDKAYGGGYKSYNVGDKANILGNSTDEKDATSSKADKYNPYNGGDKANILGPILSTLTSSISAGIASTGMKNAENILKENSSSSISLPRISAQEINLGRERADIRSQSSMNDAAARYAARNARSASEMARILNSSRLSTQRAAGEMLGKTYSTEEVENAKFRNAADSQNAQIAANEAQLMQNRNLAIDQRNLAIDQMYGPAARGRIWSQFATQTGKSIDNYIRENAKLKSDEERLLMENPDMKIDYEYPKDGTFLKNLLYSTGLRKGKKTISVREKPSVRQKDESIHE